MRDLVASFQPGRKDDLIVFHTELDVFVSELWFLAVPFLIRIDEPVLEFQCVSLEGALDAGEFLVHGLGVDEAGN